MQDLRGLSGVVAIDRDAMGEIVRTSLIGCNMRVPMIVEDVERALVACEAHQPDVLFVSFIFNGRPALELMQAIRSAKGGIGRLNPKTPIIITSPNANPKQVKTALAAGAHEFLALPASQDALIRVVDRGVNGARDWVTTRDYTGPDRRRQQVANLPFPDRRKRAEDHGDGATITN